MKKILIFIFILISNIGLTFAASGDTSNCTFDPKTGSIFQGLNDCLGGTKLVTGKNVKVGDGFSIMLQGWIDNIAMFLGVLAATAIVVGALMLVFSGGEDEKVTKAKNTVKWGIVGFLGLIAASTIINLIVKIIYSI